MNGDFGNVQRIDGSKTTANGFIDAVGVSAAGNHVAIISFDSSAVLDMGLSSDAAALKGAINNLNTRGGTEYVPPLNMAKTVLDGGRVGVNKVIVFLSDGQARDGNDDAETTQMVMAAESQLTAGTKVFTIGIGSDDDMSLLLVTMPQNGGISGTADEPNKLQQIYTNIAGQITC
jgi:Mg-chelatase subunit ChlD